MKIIVTLLTIIFSLNTYAKDKGFELAMELSVEGKTVSRSTLVIEEGKQGVVSQEQDNQKTTFEVVAKDGEFQGKKGILMNFNISHIEKDGSKTIKIKPTLLSQNGEPASITIGNGKEEMLLKVTATRKAL